MNKLLKGSYAKTPITFLLMTATVSMAIALVQPPSVSALTFKKGEKKSFDNSVIQTQPVSTMTKEEKKNYKKDQAQAEKKGIFQHDWREVAGDDSYGSFKSVTFHNELVSGKKFPAVGEPSSAFDGIYKYDFQCHGDEVGAMSPWDGSSFFIRNGIIGNDRGGAGRVKMEFGTVNDEGKFLMKFFRQSPGSRKYMEYEYLFSGQLGTESASRFRNRHLAGNFYGFSYKHPVKGGERDDGKFRYDLGCIGFLEKTADISEMAEITPFEGEAFTVKTRNPTDAWDLLQDGGDELEIEIKISGDDTQIEKGFVLILPSSGPDMSDEEYYAKAFNEMGYASVVLYGAEPRYSSKFSTSYTSYMQARDAVAALDFLETRFGLGDVVAITGSSQGSLAALRTVIAPYIESFPNLAKITHIAMINAACPDVLEVPLSQSAKIITFNGRWDNAPPPEICTNMKASSDAAITNIVYDGGHHFESPYYRKGISDGKHLLANCALGFHENLDESATVRSTGKTRRLSEGGSFSNYSKWVIDNCLESGTAEGYEEASAKQMWAELEAFLGN